MKIIQSLWSRPTFKKEELGTYKNKKDGGWLDRKYYYMSWALSCLQFKAFYEEVELVTDNQGYDLLVNRLGLPYTRVDVVLDDLNEYHIDLWALGKIYAYGIQQAPFIHADGDIYIWEKFDQRLENAPLIAQHIDEDTDYYKYSFKQVAQEFDYVPDAFYSSIQKNHMIVGANAGVMGGNDTGFFENFSSQAFDFIKKNTTRLDKINVFLFNVIMEQFLFHSLAEERSLPIEYFTRNINHRCDEIVDLMGSPTQVKYVHPSGPYKKDRLTCELVAFYLKKYHPVYHDRILSLLKNCEI